MRGLSYKNIKMMVVYISFAYIQGLLPESQSFSTLEYIKLYVVNRQRNFHVTILSCCVDKQLVRSSV